MINKDIIINLLKEMDLKSKLVVHYDNDCIVLMNNFPNIIKSIVHDFDYSNSILHRTKFCNYWREEDYIKAKYSIESCKIDSDNKEIKRFCVVVPYNSIKSLEIIEYEE